MHAGLVCDVCSHDFCVLFSLEDFQPQLTYEMAENGTDCEQRRVGVSKEQHNGSFTGMSSNCK